ncbi:hypothetical protein RI129_001770 [Pyrocoelia pectoralis]|uniref:Uncharacterized protein n=1 Tax=Pyrocoelia pectoralis TaxID=417401 RepID=A0AAN7VUM2_9COLE
MHSTELPNFTLTQKLANWAVTCHTPHAHINLLLQILREENLDVPKCSKTLLNTPRSCPVVTVSPGIYSHLGVEKGIIFMLSHNNVRSETLPEILEISLNVDGLPISSSSNASFWPIMALLNSKSACLKDPFIIGVYQGNGKPDNVTEYLDSCVKEMQHLYDNGLEYDNKQFRVKVLNLICDAPAKAFVLCVKGHNASHGCNKCYVEGGFGSKTMSFPDLNCALRNDHEYRTKLDDDYHKGTSPLEKLSYFDMIKNVPLDYMHLVLLGVGRKYISFLIKGKLGTRLLPFQQDRLNTKLLKTKSNIPDDFARKPREIYSIDRWKATEVKK